MNEQLATCRHPVAPDRVAARPASGPRGRRRFRFTIRKRTNTTIAWSGRVALAGVLATSVLLLILTPAARAGGDFVDLAASGSHVWFVGEAGVRELDAQTGRTLKNPRLAGAPYPLSVALAGDATWVASVENGYVWGTLTRIDARTGQTRVLWRKPDSSVQYVAAGAGSVWALIGSTGPTRIARFTLTGKLSHIWTIAGAGRIAADASGCWISTNHWLIHIDTAGHIDHVARAQLGDVATGAGSVWLPQTASIIRVDERNDRIRILATGRLHLGGFQHDLAAGDGAIWTLDKQDRSHTKLDRLNLNSGRLTSDTDVPGIADAIAVTQRALWIATVIAPPNQPASGYDVLRLDPRTLHRTLLVHVN